MSQSTFLTVEDVANSLRVTRQTVSIYIKDNDLNAIKINKSYRITVGDFQSFIANNSITQEPQVAYLKKSKNCLLDYSNKSDEFEVLYNASRGLIKNVEKNHQLTDNMFIFGDNLLVIRELLITHRNKVDLIYIDPPFGTGQDFNSIEDVKAYSDRLVDSVCLLYTSRCV